MKRKFELKLVEEKNTVHYEYDDISKRWSIFLDNLYNINI